MEQVTEISKSMKGPGPLEKQHLSTKDFLFLSRDCLPGPFVGWHWISHQYLSLKHGDYWDCFPLLLFSPISPPFPFSSPSLLSHPFLSPFFFLALPFLSFYYIPGALLSIWKQRFKTYILLTNISLSNVFKKHFHLDSHAKGNSFTSLTI